MSPVSGDEKERQNREDGEEGRHYRMGDAEVGSHRFQKDAEAVADSERHKGREKGGHDDQPRARGIYSGVMSVRHGQGSCSDRDSPTILEIRLGKHTAGGKRVPSEMSGTRVGPGVLADSCASTKTQTA